jgi:hypothetical protein
MVERPEEMNLTEKDSQIAGDEQHAASARRPNPTRKQFGISALFWLTFMVGLALAYLQRQDNPEILIGGIISVGIGLLAGFAFGLLTGKTADAVFWATLIAAFGYLATAGDPAVDLAYRLIWASIGAVTGAVGATVFTKQIALNALACAFAAGIVMLALSPLSPQNSADIKFDLYASPVFGVAVSFFLRILIWLESKRRMPRYITATWLLVVVIIGSWLS